MPNWTATETPEWPGQTSDDSSAAGGLASSTTTPGEGPGVAEKVASLTSGIFGANADWDLLKKTFIAVALGGLGWLALVVMRPRRH